MLFLVIYVKNNCKDLLIKLFVFCRINSLVFRNCINVSLAVESVGIVGGHLFDLNVGGFGAKNNCLNAAGN